MKKRNIFLLLLLALAIFGYIKLFYSSININAVPSNADMVATIDVKKVVRTALWNIIKQPSKLSWSSSTKDTTGKVDLKDVFEMPDYAQAFHIGGEPMQAWYFMLQVKDGELLTKALVQYNFKKTTANQYSNDSLKLGVLINDKNIIISSYGLDSNTNLNKISDLLFVKKSFLADEKFTKIKNADSHASLFIAANKFLKEDAIVITNLSNDAINIDVTFTPQDAYKFVENTFSTNSNAMIGLGFVQPPANVYALVSDADKANIGKAIGVNLDTLLIPSNKYYNLNMLGIKPRIDSAITYEYDDDFNKVEKVVVNNVDEPDFGFNVIGDSIKYIYNNWVANKTLAITGSDALFRPMPFAKSYCTVTDKQLLIAPKTYVATTSTQQLNAVFYLNILVEKLSANYLKYFPEDVKNTIVRISKANIICNQKDKQLVLKAQIDKADAAKGFLDF